MIQALVIDGPSKGSRLRSGSFKLADLLGLKTVHTTRESKPSGLPDLDVEFSTLADLLGPKTAPRYAASVLKCDSTRELLLYLPL